MTEVTLVGAGVNPHKQRVRVEGQAETFSTTVDEFENVSARDRNSFSWTIVPADFGAAETILLIQNDNALLHLHLTEVDIQTDNASPVQIHLTDRATLTPAGGALVVGVCWNQTAPRVAEAIARSNETANAQGNIIFNEPVAANTATHIDLHGAVVLAKGQSLGVDLTTASTSLASCTIRGFFAIPDEARV